MFFLDYINTKITIPSIYAIAFRLKYGYNILLRRRKAYQNYLSKLYSYLVIQDLE